jgi:hypothetical protein
MCRYPRNARARLEHKQVNHAQRDHPSSRNRPSGKDGTPFFLRCLASQLFNLRKVSLFCTIADSGSPRRSSNPKSRASTLLQVHRGHPRLNFRDGMRRARRASTIMTAAYALARRTNVWRVETGQEHAFSAEAISDAKLLVIERKVVLALATPSLAPHPENGTVSVGKAPTPAVPEKSTPLSISWVGGRTMPERLAKRARRERRSERAAP